MNSCDRMTPEQIARLALAICATAETLGQTISSDAADLMAEDLSDYPASVVAKALQACRRELTGKLTLAAILQRVDAEDGRPGEDEAWALALAASDESDSVVMTQEIHVALSAARAVLEAGDKIGARMAFKSAYARAVHKARSEAIPVKWSLSMGSDPQRRLTAVEEAAKQGRLPAPQVAVYIEQLTHAPITDDGQAIAGLLTGNVATPPSPHLREKWREVRDQVNRNKAEAEARRKEQRKAEQAALAALKAEAATALAQLQKEAVHG